MASWTSHLILLYFNDTTPTCNHPVVDLQFNTLSSQLDVRPCIKFRLLLQSHHNCHFLLSNLDSFKKGQSVCWTSMIHLWYDCQASIMKVCCKCLNPRLYEVNCELWLCQSFSTWSCILRKRRGKLHKEHCAHMVRNRDSMCWFSEVSNALWEHMITMSPRLDWSWLLKCSWEHVSIPAVKSCWILRHFLYWAIRFIERNDSHLIDFSVWSGSDSGLS